MNGLSLELREGLNDRHSECCNRFGHFISLSPIVYGAAPFRQGFLQIGF
jgi:hypothetical protein